MDAKEMLLSVRHLELRLRAIDYSVRKIRMDIVSLKAIDYSKDMVQNAIHSDISDLIVRQEEHLCKLNAVWGELISRRTDVLQVLNKMDDHILYTLLFEYYINGLTWSEVAERICYTREYTIEVLHIKALRDFEKHLTESYSPSVI